MSSFDLYTSRHEVAKAVTPKRRPVRPMLWALGAIVMMAGSVGVRFWQDRKLEMTAVVGDAPFPLKELPDRIPGWKLVEGGEQHLDPNVVRVSGATDHIVRTYVNEQTGVVVTALLSFGHGQFLSGHIPEVCYPAAGYRAGTDQSDRSIPTQAGPLPFRSLVFSREGGATPEHEEVYYSFRHDGRWNPDAAANWKIYRHRPAMFKLQVQRRMGPLEKRLLDNPTEYFLSSFVSVLEEKLGQGGGGAAKPAPAATPKG
ncbi:MAG: exosortase-associated EpsI family protein [Isosphaeraceae bacterium]